MRLLLLLLHCVENRDSTQMINQADDNWRRLLTTTTTTTTTGAICMSLPRLQRRRKREVEAEADEQQ